LSDGFTERMRWSHAPEFVREVVAEKLKTRIIAAEDVHGGTESVGAVAQACQRTADHEAPEGIPPVLERLPDLDGWAAVDPTDEWEKKHVPELAALVTGWREWTAGSVLVHEDIRCDNAIVQGDQATLVDWAYCSAGARWLDRAHLAVDIVGSGHVDGVDVAVRQAMKLLVRCPSEAARYVVAITGMWRRNSTLPDYPALPTFRRWQKRRAIALRPLLEEVIRTYDFAGIARQ
jgi:hypothetical protein